MFGSAAMVNSDLKESDFEEVNAFLRLFSSLMLDSCSKAGIGRAHTPFGRPSNFLVVLDREYLHLVIDRTFAGAMPSQRYIDRRQSDDLVQSNAIMGEAVRELAYVNPIAVRLPISLLQADAATQRQHLQPLISEGTEQLMRQAKVEQLRLPDGYHHYVRLFPEFLQDHPNPERNVFLMMRFKAGEQYDLIAETLRRQLAKHDLEVLRSCPKTTSYFYN